MADDLIFPIGFDLEKGVEEASKDWDKYAKKLEKALAKRAVKVKLSLDTTKLDNLEDVKKRLAQIKIEPITPDTRNSIKELAKELQTLAKALEQVQKFSSTNQLGQQNFRNDVTLERLRQANERLEIQKRRVALAEQKHTEAMQRSATASKNLSQSYSEQDGYVSRLLKRMAVYAAYSGVNTFLTSVREVTAQFELQRISLGAIIQDQQKANQIFAEIKSFALTSPLKILDLTKYTKQMAAYGFATDQVFDVTKRLADISVGLGVDMGRLSLAVSQIKAATVLKSSELRQLTETGLPMLDLLAKKLTETQGKIVTTADVMDLISKRAISYEMVEEILYDLTDAGGMFYNMQIKQSQTLFGMWSKLGDAAAIMYDEIGNTQGVNEGMKTLIHVLELLMRNWKDTARVIDVAVSSMAVYALGLKNAAISTKALAGTTALLNLAHKQQVIQTPKIVAAIIGQNLATKTSTTLTRLHTTAVLRQAAATNILTSSFWKLTAAMLANPWVAAAAAITAVGLALFHFIGNTETAAERVEKLNNSVAALKNLDDTITPMIDTYNELINKTERTAEEEKKLSEVTHELAKRYPGAITAIGDFGEQVDLAADKLNKLYQAERQARLDQVARNLKKIEAQIQKYEEEYTSLQTQIEQGGRIIPKYNYDGEIPVATGGTEFIPLTDADKDRIIQRMNDLNDGVGDNPGLIQLRIDAENARRTLGLIPSEAEQAIEKFGAWKKTLTTFRQQVGDVRVSLFDDSTINQFSSLDEALKKTAEEYKKNIALVATYDDTLKSTLLTAEERAKIETERAEADAMATLAENALKYFNALSLLNTTSGGGRSHKSDPRLQNLKEEISLVQKLYNEYKQLEKQEGASKAASDMERMAKASLDMLSKKYGISLPTTAKDLTSALEILYKKMAALPKKVFPALDKELNELRWTIEKVNIDESQKQIEKQLKELADRISRTKTAKEFYEKILGMTGDLNLAGKVSMSIYGDNGDLKALLAKQVRELTNGIELPEGIIKADNLIDYKALREFAEANKDELGKTYDELVKIAEDGQKDLAKTYEGYLKDLEKAKTYSDKRVELARYTANKIAEIEASTLPDAEKKRLTAGYRERESQKQGELEWEAFKDMPMYVQMFDDLDNASVRTLSNMKQRLSELQSVWGSTLNPTQLKELQSRMSEIDAQLAKKNPFKTLSDSIKEYKELRLSHGSEDKLGKEIEAATDEYNAVRKALTKQLKENPQDTEAVENLQKRVDLSEKELKQLQKIADAYKKVKDAIGLSLGEVFKIVNALGDLASGIGKLTGVFGGSEEDVQYWNDIADGLNEVTSGIENMVQAALSGNPIGVATAAVTAIPNMISGFASLFSAGKIKRANKEIKRQQELLDRLEYTYGRLEKAAEKAFGGDFINNFKAQQKNLEAQAQAYMRQAEAERSKGKDADEDKIKEYENAYRDTLDAIADMQGKIAEQMAGTDVESAARDFAQAWLEAYATFSNTTGAIKDKFNDMIKNMVVESVMGKVVQQSLQPMFDEMNEMYLRGESTTKVLSYAFRRSSELAEELNRGLLSAAREAEAAGVDLKGLYQTSDNMKGISRTTAGASEESINANTAALTTQNYYASHLPTISENVAAMRMLMEGGTTTNVAATPAGWTDWQQQAMDNYIAIQRNTADMVVECRNIAAKCQAQTELLKKVIVPKGVTPSYRIYTKSDI